MYAAEYRLININIRKYMKIEKEIWIKKECTKYIECK